MLLEQLKALQRDFINASIKTTASELVIFLLPVGQVVSSALVRRVLKTGARARAGVRLLGRV